MIESPPLQEGDIMDFPSTLPMPDLPFNEEPEDPGMRTQMENGSTKGRRKFTKRRLRYVRLNWRNIPLTQTEYDALQTFLNSVGGSALNFNWIHPVTHVTYVMYVIDQGSFEWGVDGNPGWSGGIILGEA
jgi:hypothetical protein